MEEIFNLPLCIIPSPIIENYKEKVRQFYKKDGKTKIEKFSKGIESKFGIRFKKLSWDNNKGLTNISFEVGGLDLNETRYVFHNIWHKSSYGKAAFEVAEKYISELLKIK